MALNIKLLKKMRDRIAKVPESYDQAMWAVRTDKSPCGTTACLAGEAIICSKRTVPAGLKLLWKSMDDPLMPGPYEMGMNLLGLSWYEADTMFSVGAPWPEPYGSQFRCARTRKQRAAVAIAYLDHIIASGEVLE